MTGELEVAYLRDRVAKLESRVALLYKHLGLPYGSPTDLDGEPRIVAELKKGNMLGAIKVYRELTDTTVDDARKAVEEMQARLGLKS